MAAAWAAVNDIRLPQTRRLGTGSRGVAGKSVGTSGEKQDAARNLADQAKQGEGLGQAGFSGLKGHVGGANKDSSGHSGAKDFELVEGADVALNGARGMGVAVTLALVRFSREAALEVLLMLMLLFLVLPRIVSTMQLPSGLHLLDPTLHEEIALPPHLRLCVVASPSETEADKPLVWSAQLLSDPLNSEVGASGRDPAVQPRIQDSTQSERQPSEVGELLEEAWGAPDLSRVRASIKVSSTLLAGNLAGVWLRYSDYCTISWAHCMHCSFTRRCVFSSLSMS